jgi:hypothetical protein
MLSLAFFILPIPKSEQVVLGCFFEAKLKFFAG